MKFKYIFLLFNIILLLFIVFIFLFPFFMLEKDFALSFWRKGWPLALIIFLIALVFNTFYAANRLLFKLLEREDWPALAQYLEEKVVSRGRFSPRLVKLLANTYLVLSDPYSVLKLEKKLALAKPALVDANSLLFGIARILGADKKEAAAYFAQRAGMPKNEKPEWMGWYGGFTSLLAGDYETAANSFIIAVTESRNPLIIGLSSYFLSEKLREFLPGRADECGIAAETGRTRIRKYLPNYTAWKKELAGARNDIHVAVISKYVQEAGLWFYEKG